MRSIFRNLKGSWKTVCIIFLLLIVQAYCDLALPTYMSDIVDVGIQQNGMVKDLSDGAVIDKVRLLYLRYIRAA